MNRNSYHNQEQEYIHTFDDQESYWATFDLGCAAALASIGFEIVSLDRANPSKIKFIFVRKSGLEDSIKDYWNFDLNVDAQTYFNSIKRLKNQIYSG